MAKIYKTDGSILEVEPLNGTDFSLRELQEIVGGYIECVFISHDKIMVINEDGRRTKPVNIKATAEYMFRTRIESEILHGDVLFCNGCQID